MNSDINTNVRLFDLVRFMRSELHDANLITDQEYGWLCAEAPMAKGQGSPSPRRLEDYDEVKATHAAEVSKLRAALKNCLGWTHRAMELEGSGSMLMAATEHAESARLLLDSENAKCAATGSERNDHE